MYNIYAKPAIYNTTTKGISYKELYDCKYYPMTLTNNSLYTPALGFYKYFVLMMACIWPKLVAIT
jgi:hypothetical protein